MEKKISYIFRLVGTILGVALIISLAVLVIGVIFRWNTSIQFSNAFFVAGGIAIVIGTLSITGGFEQRADFGMLYAQSAGQSSLSERVQHMMADINQRYGVLVLMIGTGLVLIAVSIVISQLF